MTMRTVMRRLLLLVFAAGLVALVEDMDPDQLARLYGRLKPRLEEAYAELGVPGTFDEAMVRAIRHLLETPIPPANAAVQQAKGTNYAYVDKRFEGLSPAQRQLLRLGMTAKVEPEAQRRIAQWLPEKTSQAPGLSAVSSVHAMATRRGRRQVAKRG